MALHVDPAEHDREQEELRLLYAVTTQDLSYFKTQQWSVTYYALLIDAGLVGVAQLLSANRTILDRIALVVLTFGAAAAAMLVLYKLQASITVRQSRLESLRAAFTETFRRVWSAQHKPPEYIHSVYLLYGGIALTAILTAWLVGMRL